MGFVSILGKKPFQGKGGKDEEVPDFFMDLNLDRVLEVVAESKKEYGIETYFYHFVEDADDIHYRQDVFKDLEDKAFFDGVAAFGRTLLKAHEYEGYYNECKEEWQKKRWHLDFAHTYCTAIKELRDLLSQANIRSEGFALLREWLNAYWESEEFQGFYQDTDRLVREFGDIRYSLEIDRDKVVVNLAPIEGDYCKRIQEIFGNEGEVAYMENPLPGTLEMPYLEQRILGVLRKPYQEVFVRLTEYCDKRVRFMDKVVLRFEKEVQFYLSFLLFKGRLEAKGFSFAYPKVGGDEFYIKGLYDIALAWKNLSDGKPVVCNDACYKDEERFFIVTGPNQGGKTTFARAIGQTLYFMKMGMPAPCADASLPLMDELLTHFSVEESLETGRGKLKEELIRLKPMMNREAKNSFVIINELFTTAATYDAYQMGRRVIDYFIGQGCYGVYVTHISDLAEENDKIVSMTAGLDEEGGGKRTFRIERHPASGFGHANTLVAKYHLTYQEVKEVLGG